MYDTLTSISNNSNINYPYNNSSEIYPEMEIPISSFIVNRNSKLNNDEYSTLVCYNCLSVILIRNDWKHVRCGVCQKVNKIPKVAYNESFVDRFFGEISVTCPFCATSNIMRRDDRILTCLKCGKNLKVAPYSEIKRESFFSDSQSIPKKIHFRETVNVIPTGEINTNNYCHCNNTKSQLFLLDKILEKLKKKKKPFIPYTPVFIQPLGISYPALIGSGYYFNNRYNNDDERTIIKIPYRVKNVIEKKEPEPENFKITVRKFKTGENNGKKMTRSASFEKVFFTNTFKDGLKYEFRKSKRE